MLEYDPTQRDAFYLSLLTNPGERGEVDYKASLPLCRDDGFSLKLFRHIIGMANAGGGWLVIGYQENPNLKPDPNHTESVCASYDTTVLSRWVNRVVMGGNEPVRVSVNQVRHPDTNLNYPIIQVEGFMRSPFFCRSTRKAVDSGDQILTEGTLYIRRPGAETTPLSAPSDWEALITRCVQMRRDEFLHQLEELLGRMGLRITPQEPITVPPSDWLSEMRRRAMGM